MMKKMNTQKMTTTKMKQTHNNTNDMTMRKRTKMGRTKG